MSESQHTPSPWQVNSIGYHHIEAGRSIIGVVYDSLPDAHLIAAAPDLLAALEAMIVVFDDVHTTAAQCGSLGQAKNAIAKAMRE